MQMNQKRFNSDDDVGFKFESEKGENKMKQTTYSIAINWLRPSLVLCNKIAEIDPSVFDNARFSFYDEDEENETEIFQWYLTNFSLDDVEWIEKNFPDIKFTYSDMLDCFVLCVDHWGTGWDYVATSISDDLLKINQDIEYKDSCNPPKFVINREIKKG